MNIFDQKRFDLITQAITLLNPKIGSSLTANLNKVNEFQERKINMEQQHTNSLEFELTKHIEERRSVLALKSSRVLKTFGKSHKLISIKPVKVKKVEKIEKFERPWTDGSIKFEETPIEIFTPLTKNLKTPNREIYCKENDILNNCCANLMDIPRRKNYDDDFIEMSHSSDDEDDEIKPYEPTLRPLLERAVGKGKSSITYSFPSQGLGKTFSESHYIPFNNYSPISLKEPLTDEESEKLVKDIIKCHCIPERQHINDRPLKPLKEQVPLMPNVMAIKTPLEEVHEELKSFFLTKTLKSFDKEDKKEPLVVIGTALKVPTVLTELRLIDNSGTIIKIPNTIGKLQISTGTLTVDNTDILKYPTTTTLYNPIKIEPILQPTENDWFINNPIKVEEPMPAKEEPTIINKEESSWWGWTSSSTK